MAWPKPFQFEALLKSLRPSSRDIAIQALVAGLVFFGGKLGLLFDPDHLMAAPIWPAAGLALGALLVFGYRSWAGIIIGVFLLDLTVLVDAKQNPIVTIAACVCMACAETLQALVAAWLIETRARGRDALAQPRTLAFFFALGAIIAPAISVSLQRRTCGTH